MFFKTYWILWQNARNLNYIREYNTKFAKRLADSKLKTKDFLKTKWVAVPDTLFVFNKQEELIPDIFDNLDPPFVVKPNGGFWGKWILVFDKKDVEGNYVTNSGKVYSIEDLLIHFSDILDWFYSLSWNRDKVVIEKKIELWEEIELLWKYGLPDIRVITFNMVPVMAMLRVPTSESHGKANLHSWACGVWIDIWTWKLTYITKHSKIVKSVPGIWDVRGIEIPWWDNILTLAVKVQQVTKIGYLGCDIVLDKEDGPLLLEMNIRPGLEVQIANMARLKDRLEKVGWIYVNTIEKWVRLWRDLFSWDIEEKIKNISWKKVVWGREYINIHHNDKKFKYLTEIRINDTKSLMDKEFAKNVLKLKESILESGSVRLEVRLLWESKKIKFLFKDLWSVNLIIGTNSLRGFLVDPFKYKKWELPINEVTDVSKWKNIAINKNYEKQLSRVDKELLTIDKKLLILKYLAPKNLKEEKDKFISSEGIYVPHFEYNEMNLDLDWLEGDLRNIEVPDIPLSNIYKRKKKEVFNKIKLLKAFKDNTSKDITFYSKKVYGEIIEENLEHTTSLLSWKKDIKEEEELITFEEIRALLKKFNHIYDININLKRGDKTARFVMKWDTLYIRHWAKVWKKEMRSIIAHEIEWHYLRKINWKKIDYSIFWRGTAWYLEIDEWIAIYNQNRFLSDVDKKYYAIFERYYFVNYALKHSYKKLISRMIEYYDKDLDRVFTYLARLKRGLRDIKDDGIFVKDVVYVNGYLKIDDFVSSGGSLKELYVWKINILDLEEIKESYFLKIDFNDSKLPFFL